MLGTVLARVLGGHGEPVALAKAELGRLSLSDQEPSSRLIAALEAAVDSAYSWGLDGHRLAWSGPFPPRWNEFAEEQPNGPQLAGGRRPVDVAPRPRTLATH